LASDRVQCEISVTLEISTEADSLGMELDSMVLPRKFLHSAEGLFLIPAFLGFSL